MVVIIIGALAIAVITAIGDVDAKIQNISFVRSVLNTYTRVVMLVFMIFVTCHMQFASFLV